MDVNVNQQGNELFIDVTGRIDAKNTAQFQDALSDIDETITKLTFDLKNLRYISSSGLRVFLFLYKDISPRAAKIVVLNADELVYSIFKSTGLTDLFTVEELKENE